MKYNDRCTLVSFSVSLNSDDRFVSWYFGEIISDKHGEDVTRHQNLACCQNEILEILLTTISGV